MSLLSVRRAFVVVPFLALAASGAPRAAQACEREPSCKPIVVVPTGSSMPANAVAFELTSDDATGIQLLDSNGSVVPTQVSQRVLRPTAPLPKSSFTLVYPDVCAYSPILDGGAAGPRRTLYYDFIVDSNAAYPTDTGHIEVIERAIGSPPGAPGAVEIRTRLGLVASPNFAPFEQMAQLTATIDGQPWMTTWAFPGEETPGLLTVPSHCGGAWEPGACVEYFDAPPGKHTFAIAAHIPGAPSDPPPAIGEITISCDPASVLQGAGAPGDGGATPAAPGDAGVPAAAADGGACPATAEAPGAGVHGGCNGGGRAPGSFALASILALAAAALVRGRRRVG